MPRYLMDSFGHPVRDYGVGVVVIVTGSVAVCGETPAPLARTVIVPPVVAVLVALSFMLLVFAVLDRLAGSNVAVMPVGTFSAVSVTEPEKPLVRVIVIGTVVLSPARTDAVC